MMIYAISDLHGEYDKYLAMLRKINFSDSDQLYVLGDVVDRGKKPVEILQDMRRRPNVIPIMGNHDKMAIDVLTWLLQEITEQSIHQKSRRKDIHSGSRGSGRFQPRKEARRIFAQGACVYPV